MSDIIEKLGMSRLPEKIDTTKDAVSAIHALGLEDTGTYMAKVLMDMVNKEKQRRELLGALIDQFLLTATFDTKRHKLSEIIAVNRKSKKAIESTTEMTIEDLKELLK